MTRADAEAQAAARAWLHRHGFTAARLVEDLAHAVATAHAEGSPEAREADGDELAALTDGLRAWIGAAQDYVARKRGDR